MPAVYFYLNENDYHNLKQFNSLEEFAPRAPQMIWSWSTYIRLKNKGYDVELTCKIPENGIVVMPGLYPGRFEKSPDNVLMICTVADSPPLFYMPVNITQNPFQPASYRNFFYWPVWRHISHWPQPNIIPRSDLRGDRFERIAFFGHREQLDPALASESFARTLADLGLIFEVRDTNLADHSDVDAVIAIRSFSNEPYLHKPYTKLVNGWLAKTPVIVGTETAFLAVKRSELDFISVSSVDELVAALLHLKANVELRERMMKNGMHRGMEFNEESVIRQWGKLLFVDAPVYLSKWRKMSRAERQLFYVDLFLSRSVRSIKNKIRNRLRRATLS